jgi:hypothetical protein
MTLCQAVAYAILPSVFGREDRDSLRRQHWATEAAARVLTLLDDRQLLVREIPLLGKCT